MKELAIHHIPATESAPARVRVSYRDELGAQPQEHEHDFAFTLTDEQRRDIQWYLEQYLRYYPGGEFPMRAQRVESLMKVLGEQLFAAIFSEQGAFRLYAQVADDLANTRFIVFAAAPAGIALPWELLRDPKLGDAGELARLAHSFARSQTDLMSQPSVAPPSDTLNVLLVIVRPEDDLLPFQGTARPLLELFRPHRDHIRLDVVRPSTMEQLAKVLAEKPNYYHVLHYDGHGAFSHGSGSTRDDSGLTEAQGYVVFEGKSGGKHWVTGQELGALLAGKGAPVVLLNACQSGMTHPESLYPSVGSQLLQAGARGVVAMAYSVLSLSVARFMARLYEGLLNGETLAHAVTLGREALHAHPERPSPIGDARLYDWVVPVLFETAPLQLPLPQAEVCLDPELLQGQQARAGSEVGCPEPPVFGFVGRDALVLDLERAFQTETVVLLQGMAGVGKTEAALGFARWRAETGALLGPIFFFRFERYLTLAQVCDRVGQVMQSVVRQQLRQEWQLLDAEQRCKAVVAVLRQVPCLLIWDNFAPVAGFPAGSPSEWSGDAQEELRVFLQELRGGQTKVLLTSRRDEGWLGDLYQRVEVEGLHWEEASELAAKVLQRVLTAEQMGALSDCTDLIDYLRGNPLAIQVILPELARTTPGALLQGLLEGVAELSCDDPLQGRERSLSASLTCQLDRLDPVLRQRLGLLWLFQGFVDAKVLAAMCCMERKTPAHLRGLANEAWERILARAAEVGLLQQAKEGYYAVHPALPWFFRRQWQAAFPGEDGWLEEAYADAYGAVGLSLARQFAVRADYSMTALQMEEGNLRHALALARQHKQWSAARGLLYGLYQMLKTQGRWGELEQLLAELEEDAGDAEGEPRPGREVLWRAMLGTRAQLARFRRDYVAAERNLRRLLVHHEKVGDERSRAACLLNLGVLAGEQQQLDEAEGWLRLSLAVFERIGDEKGLAYTLHSLGTVAYDREQLDEAEELYRRSLDITERIGDTFLEAQTMHNRGNVGYDRKLWDKAELSYLWSLSLSGRISDEQTQALSLNQLGMVAKERRQLDEAERSYRESLAISERISDENGQAISLGQLGLLAQERRQYDEAEGWYRRSLAIDERINNEHGQACMLHNLGEVACERQQWDEAVRLFEQAEALFVRLHDPRRLEVTRRGLQQARGRNHPAQEA